MYRLLFVAVLLTGCTATYDLDDEWAPLTQIIERPGNDRWLTTIGDKVVVANLEEFLRRNPPTGLKFRTNLAHEQTHSVRQFDYGVEKFLARYVTDRSFRWEEEQLGWFVGLRLMRQYGMYWHVEGVVQSLLSYRPVLSSEEHIREWVRAVYNDTWKPKRTNLPAQYQYLCD